MTTAARIRQAAAADGEAVRQIVDQAYRGYIPLMGRKPGPMLDDYDALIAAGHVSVLAAAEQIVGVLVLIPEPAAMLLDNIAIAPQAQGKGYGKLLLEFAENAARQQGYETIRLYTNIHMAENIALYRHLGWEETHRGEEKGFQRVYMRKSL